LGLHTNALTTGAIINANLGSSIYTGTAGALRLTANSASTGTLLAISGTLLAANGGTAAQITLGTPTGSDTTTEGKAIKVALGTQGDAYHANAATGYSDSFARFRVNSVDVFAVSGTAITTTDTFSQTGAATFSTGTGAISLNGPIALNDNTTIAAGKGISVTTGGAGNFDFHNSTGTFDTRTGAVTLRGNTATASGITFTAGSGIVNAVN